MTGEVLLELTLYDPIHSSATTQQVLQKFHGIAAASVDVEAEGDDIISRSTSKDVDSDDEDETEGVDESDATVEKKSKRSKLARMRRKAKQKAYEFSGTSDLAGVLFLEISKVTDLPPERNSMQWSFRPWTRNLRLTGLHSDEDWLRHGSLRNYLAGKKDIQDESSEA